MLLQPLACPNQMACLEPGLMAVFVVASCRLSQAKSQLAFRELHIAMPPSEMRASAPIQTNPSWPTCPSSPYAPQQRARFFQENVRWAPLSGCVASGSSA